jgi:DNA helicase II / ATP-dependent DNA helicase PcrA
MNEAKLVEWLRQQQPVLDQIIADAGREYHTLHQDRPNFGFDLGACQEESFLLISNQDLCYDRPNTAFCYSLWYHARRVNTFLTQFVRRILQHDQPTLECFDLGAGTGAVQWAIGLLYHWMKASGMKVPAIRIINIDTSPFMLHYSRDFLWKHFLVRYPHCQDFNDDIEYEVNSWNNEMSITVANAWIIASYLFDISDTADIGDYRQSVLKGFKEITDAYDPFKLFLLTAGSKKRLLDEVAAQLHTNDYIIEKRINERLLLSGDLPAVNQFRKELFQQYGRQLFTHREKSIGDPADWDDPSFVAAELTKRRIELFSEKPAEKIRLHDSSIKVRRDVILNAEQKKAARNINQSTVVVGPAGCGKSIVITERIKNIVEEAEYDSGLRILVTTFNKELLGQLAHWIRDILEAGRFRIEYDTNHNGYAENSCRFYFGDSTFPNIRLLHFDMLPKVIGNVRYRGLVNEAWQKRILTDIIKDVKITYRIRSSRFDNILNPEFLLEEYHRVIYGLQVDIKDKEKYMDISRKGRGNDPQLKKNSERRLFVWDCLNRYQDLIYANKEASFTIRRQLFLSKLTKGEIDAKYDFVVVDEFQDCTQADFEIFFNLLKDANCLIIAGDLAQAVHLGKSASSRFLREALRDRRTMNDIKWNYLEGSYRLPFRICEAIKKISEHLKLIFNDDPAAGILTPYKGAPPGARPIVVYGKDEKDMTNKIRNIIEAYEHFDLSEKCILEKDESLHNELEMPTDTVLRLKGLEKHCVIWSTRAPVEFKKEKFEFVYTILSRTSCLLIIALFNDPEDPGSRTQEIFKEAIGLLRRDRVIFWDRETKDTFDAFCLGAQYDSMEEDEDN